MATPQEKALGKKSKEPAEKAMKSPANPKARNSRMKRPWHISEEEWTRIHTK